MNSVIESSFASFFERAKGEPVYVVLGAQGSGTNLLSRILSRAFKFSVIQDGSVIYRSAARLGRAPSIDEVRRQYALIRSRVFPSALVRKTKRLVKAKGSFEGMDDHFEPASIKSGADLTQFVYAYGAFTLGTDRMAIKSDDLWEHLDRIAEVLPNRRIILLTRDFRDNLLSITNKNFGPIEPLIAARYIKERFARYETEYLATAPGNRYHVRYEDILESPLAVVRALSAHFGLQPVPGGEAAVEALRLRSGRVNKWRALEPGQLAHLDAIFAEELRRYGYEPSCDNPELPDSTTWVIARAKDTLKRVPQKLERVARRLRQ